MNLLVKIIIIILVNLSVKLIIIILVDVPVEIIIITFSKSTCKIDYYYFRKTNYYFSKSTCKNDYTGPDIPNNRILLKHQVRLNCNRFNFQ